MYITYKNYRGGINNLIVVHDGLYVATSTKSIAQAMKNLKRKEKKHERKI